MIVSEGLSETLSNGCLSRGLCFQICFLRSPVIGLSTLFQKIDLPVNIKLLILLYICFGGKFVSSASIMIMYFTINPNYIALFSVSCTGS